MATPSPWTSRVSIIFCSSFKRVSKCVAQIQQCPTSVFSLISGDNGCFCTAAFCNCFRPGRTICFDFWPIIFKPFKKIGTIDQPIFSDFRIASAKFPLAQSVENICIGEHEFRLMKNPDKIFFHGVSLCRFCLQRKNLPALKDWLVFV